MLPNLLMRFFRKLRFPWLFAVTAMLLALDLLVPDVLPFVDELLLGLTTLLLGTWRSRKAEAKVEPADLGDQTSEISGQISELKSET